MNTGRRKIWICIRKRHIFIKLTDKKMDNIFGINRGKGKKNRVLVRKRSRIKRALTKRALKLMAYMSDLSFVFSEFWVLEDLYRLIKDEADQIVLEYENEREDYDEESMVF